MLFLTITKQKTRVNMGSVKLKKFSGISSFDHVDLDTVDMLYFMNLGSLKRVNLISDGYESTVDVIFDSDWIGFSGIAIGNHSFTAVSMDTGHAWTVPHDDVLHAGSYAHALVQEALSDFSQQQLLRRHVPLSVKSLSNDGRIADFFLQWSQSLLEMGQSTGPFLIHMTCADLELLFGLDFESVDQALRNLVFHGVIEMDEAEPCDVRIPSLSELKSFIQHDVALTRAVWQ